MGWLMRHGERQTSPSKLRLGGFTLIELLVVLSIIGLLLSITVPRYFQSLDNAKATVLADNLRQTREVLDHFFGDTGRYPETLDELVEKGYLKSAPLDPLTGSEVTWKIEAPPQGVQGKVYNLISTAKGVDRMGKSFSDY